MTLERSSPEYADLFAGAVCALARYFVGVTDLNPNAAAPVLQGRHKDDPVYVNVTEGRDGPTPEARAHYSSCGDLLHAILERMGVRLPAVNRRSLGHYVVGANISRLEPGALPFSKEAPRQALYRPPAGSLCLMWTTGYDAHAFVVLGPGSDNGHIMTANYGAGGMSASVAPGADLADSPCYWDDTAKRLRIGGSHRMLQCVIEPASIIPYVEAQIDLSGAPVNGEIVEALGARYDA